MSSLSDNNDQTFDLPKISVVELDRLKFPRTFKVVLEVR